MINTEVTKANDDNKGLHLLSTYHVSDIVHMRELSLNSQDNPMRWVL